MSCPSDLELAAELDGEATANRAKEISEHASGCASCRERRARLSAARAALLRAPSPSDEAFASEILSRLPATSSSPRRAPVFAAAALVSIAALGSVFLSRGVEDPAPRGSSLDVSRAVGFELLAADGSRIDGRLPVGRPIAARIFNRSKKALFLALFAADERGQLFWIEPAYDSEANDPSSIAVPAEPQIFETSSAVAFDDLRGEARVFGVFSEAQLKVKEIERLFAEGRLPSASVVVEQKLEVTP